MIGLGTFTIGIRERWGRWSRGTKFRVKLWPTQWKGKREGEKQKRKGVNGEMKRRIKGRGGKENEKKSQDEREENRTGRKRKLIVNFEKYRP